MDEGRVGFGESRTYGGKEFRSDGRRERRVVEVEGGRMYRWIEGSMKEKQE